MRAPRAYAILCILVLAAFALSKQFGWNAGFGTFGRYASTYGNDSSSSSSSSGGGGFFGASSSHK